MKWVAAKATHSSSASLQSHSPLHLSTHRGFPRFWQAPSVEFSPFFFKVFFGRSFFQICPQPLSCAGCLCSLLYHCLSRRSFALYGPPHLPFLSSPRCFPPLSLCCIYSVAILYLEAVLSWLWHTSGLLLGCNGIVLNGFCWIQGWLCRALPCCLVLCCGKMGYSPLSLPPCWTLW